jgi:hypothetical protein
MVTNDRGEHESAMLGSLSHMEIQIDQGMRAQGVAKGGLRSWTESPTCMNEALSDTTGLWLQRNEQETCILDVGVCKPNGKLIGVATSYVKRERCEAVLVRAMCAFFSVVCEGISQPVFFCSVSWMCIDPIGQLSHFR